MIGFTYIIDTFCVTTVMVTFFYATCSLVEGFVHYPQNLVVVTNKMLYLDQYRSLALSSFHSIHAIFSPRIPVGLSNRIYLEPPPGFKSCISSCQSRISPSMAPLSRVHAFFFSFNPAGVH